ncbi:beta-N-acetylhexosaminidase [Ornithinibacillus bavariensis]|uniref:N-acetyl-beta-D-glucosaminidase n=1 Tax=Ornithinibacillus bavariensis TaxID=545502 RepID=A0A919X9X7_9BACI|nr:beta-N-acetylhexosaminidase [Ornithinibacillus bavariensis]GIO27082.1 N-acetyl-beta-D-glucosaminidase [Ornithinibacillus bavariensis]
MKIQFTGDVNQLLSGITELQNDYDFVVSNHADIILHCKENRYEKNLHISYQDGRGTITYQKPSHFFRAFGLLLEHLQKGEIAFFIEEIPQFETIGPMFDLSRNAVLKTETFKDLIRKLAVMGFDSAMLYMEDIYEVRNEPYFGYMRGRYSQVELKSLDDYAHNLGIELIPCIQTLAHLEEFLKWNAAYRYKDTRGALLLESDDTYDLLDTMIQSVTAPFRSKRIHIGMDEAEEVGRGRYLNLNGYKPRFELMVEHLEKVLAITEKYGLKAMMWSDMFLKLASKTGDQYSKNTEMPAYIIEKTPKNVQLMYWQYNQTDGNHYEQIIEQHKRFSKTPAFAGGMWIWNTFAPNYNLSLPASKAALTACKKHGVKDVFVTLWGDDGFENNVYTALFGLQYYAEHAFAKEIDEEKLKDRVKFCTGIDPEMFFVLNELDTPPGVSEGNLQQTNPSKFLLWQDVLLGLFDKHVEGLEMQPHYEKIEKRINNYRINHHGNLDYIFSVPEKLSRVLALKATIGVQLKQAYDTKNMDILTNLANVLLPELIVRVKALRVAHREQWLKLNKPFGWEVIDIRYGGLINRIDTAIKRLNDYLNHSIDSIEELEQERLFFSPDVQNSTSLGWCSYYYRIASPNVFFHVLPIY